MQNRFCLKEWGRDSKTKLNMVQIEFVRELRWTSIGRHTHFGGGIGVVQWVDVLDVHNAVRLVTIVSAQLDQWSQTSRVLGPSASALELMETGPIGVDQECEQNQVYEQNSLDTIDYWVQINRTTHRDIDNGIGRGGWVEYVIHFGRTQRSGCLSELGPVAVVASFTSVVVQWWGGVRIDSGAHCVVVHARHHVTQDHVQQSARETIVSFGQTRFHLDRVPGSFDWLECGLCAWEGQWAG